jgi:hypothetical protein
MTNEHFDRKRAVANLATPTRKSYSPFLRSVELMGQHRKLRIALPLPRRQECLTKRALVAAMRAAELAEWEASGGDYLARGPMHQPVHDYEI